MPNTEEYMYPEVYKNLSPICDQVINDMENKYGNVYLSDDLLAQMSNEAVRRLETDDNKNNMGDAVPTIRDYGRRGNSGRDRWRDYDRDSLSDIAEILILSRLFGRRRPHRRRR